MADITVKDCKCGAKYIHGLRSLENGQITYHDKVDGMNQFVCCKCHNELNATMEYDGYWTGYIPRKD